jgi:Family of unknown function (DUF5681)
MNSFDDDQAGYGKPPKRFRFKKGRSGNPSGKPGAKKHSSVLMTKALLRLVPVKRDGCREKVTKLHAVATQLVKKATEGDYQFIRLLLDYCSWIHSELTEPIRQRGGLPPEVGRAIRRALLGLPDEDDSLESEIPQGIEHAPAAVKLDLELLEEEKQTGPSEVGFRRPPAQYRFRKGQSGNLAGRPPALKTFERLLRRLLLQRVRLTENGCVRSVVRLQVIFEQIVNRAALGSPRFQRLLLEYIPSVDRVLDQGLRQPKNLNKIIRSRLFKSMDSDD